MAAAKAMKSLAVEAHGAALLMKGPNRWALTVISSRCCKFASHPAAIVAVKLVLICLPLRVTMEPIFELWGQFTKRYEAMPISPRDSAGVRERSVPDET